MALATSLGTAIFVSGSSSARVWRVYGYPDHVYVYTEISVEEQFEWVALAKAIAQSTVAAAAQTDENGTALAAGDVASWSAQEDRRAVGSYKVTLNITYAPTTTLAYEDYPTP